MGVGEFKTIRRSGYLTAHDLFVHFGVADETILAAIDSGQLSAIDTMTPQARRDVNTRTSRSHGITPLSGYLFKGEDVQKWLDAGLPTSKPRRESPAARAKKVVGGTRPLSVQRQSNTGPPQ